MYGRDVGEVRRSLCGSIDGSARVLFNSLTRSEQAASGNSKRAGDREGSWKSFHSVTRLRGKRIFASGTLPFLFATQM